MEQITISTGIFCLISLVLLHFLSPEFSPKDRMISEYALGKQKFWLTVFFFSWGISSLALSSVIYQHIEGTWGLVATILSVVSGLGAIFGGLFDLNHRLHGVAFALGVPFVPILALITAYQWPTGNLVISAHSTWISLVLMGLTMGQFMGQLKKAGVPTGPDQKPLEKLPEGIKSIHGYMNRLLVVSYLLFNILVGYYATNA